MKRFSASAFSSVCLLAGLVCLRSPLHAMKFEAPFIQQNSSVTIRVGLSDAPGGEVDIRVKAEGRRLVFYAPGVNLNKGSTKDIKVGSLPGGVYYEITFSVNTRTPDIPGGGRVSLKPDEIGHPRGDDVLSIEDLSFTTADGKQLRPLYYNVDVKPDENMPVVYLAGDSTVCDQRDEPWATWGMMIPAFFGPGTAVANHAESGLALSSFAAQNRLAKILSAMKAGDWVMIQFGHNDQKETGPEAGADKGYSKRLASMIDSVKAKGAHPVVLTPVERRRFRDGKPYGTLQDYAAAAKRVAAEKGRPGHRPERHEPQILRGARRGRLETCVRALPGEHVPRPAAGAEGRHAPQSLRRIRARKMRGAGHPGKRAGARETSAPGHPRFRSRETRRFRLIPAPVRRRFVREKTGRTVNRRLSNVCRENFFHIIFPFHDFFA